MAYETDLMSQGFASRVKFSHKNNIFGCFDKFFSVMCDKKAHVRI